ncbi:MAG: EutN/CcmL family microcompartment protein [Anaerolineae bacterium]|nr:EutN/CcmL family microcompartment protein [Anaerolineae bacterium]
MLLGKIVGTAVATMKTAGLAGVKLLVVQRLNNKLEPVGNLQVAADGAQQAGLGDTVVLVRAREAALTLTDTFVPVDLAVVGVVDQVNIDPSIQDFALPFGLTKYS